MYDVQVKANYGEGNAKGKLNFKVRQNNDNPQKFDEEFSKLKDSFNFAGVTLDKNPATTKNKIK